MAVGREIAALEAPVLILTMRTLDQGMTRWQGGGDVLPGCREDRIFP